MTATLYAVLAVDGNGDVTMISPIPADRVRRACEWLEQRHPSRRIRVYELLAGSDGVRQNPDPDTPMEVEYRVQNLADYGLRDVREVAVAQFRTVARRTPRPRTTAPTPSVPLSIVEPEIRWVLAQVTSEALRAFPGAIHSIILVGSASRELTAASDLDIAVVFHDQHYPRRVFPLRDALRSIAESVVTLTGRPVSLWPSRVDHYVTSFPDVSYVRANLPIVEGRLDAWCGLAKTALIHYEIASAVALYGDISTLRTGPKKIPQWESTELFLLATRTLAEGVCEMDSPATADSGRNHIAKAVLRAAYAAILQADQTPLNSYAEIRDAALERLPAQTHPVVKQAYAVKRGRSDSLPKIRDVLGFMTQCESTVSSGPSLQTAGTSDGRLSEAFHFERSSVRRGAAVEPYRRAPGFEANFYTQAYFLSSAREVARRLAESSPSAEVLDFYAEELLNVASWGLFSQDSGLQIPVGDIEPETMRIWFRGPWFARMGGLLSSVAALRLLRNPATSRSARGRTDLFPVCLVLTQLARAPQIPVDADVLAALQALCRDDRERAIRWQAGILSGAARDRMMQQARTH